MSNFPPGVTENMIPGNRPGDIYQQDVLGFIAVDIDDLTAEQAAHVQRLIDVGWDHRDKVATTVEQIDAWLKLEGL